MEDWELRPGERPIFMDPERVEATREKRIIEQAGIFDCELEGLTTPLPDLENDLPARGKGPSRGYEERYRLIALYHSLGYTNNQIASHLGYSAPGISLALSKPFVQTEIERLRLQHAMPEAQDTMKRATSAAALRLEKAIMNPDDKAGHDAAKFVLEKVTGKARQEVQVESGTILSFMELIRDMNNRGIPAGPPREVTETAEVLQRSDSPQQDEFDTWLNTNL